MPENARLRLVRDGDAPTELRRLIVKSVDEATDLLESWRIALRASGKPVKTTIRTYTVGVRQFIKWCDDSDLPVAFDRGTVTTWIAEMIEHGAQGSTAASRQTAIKGFAKWLFVEGEVERYDLEGLAKPKANAQPLKPLSEDELRALFAACKGTRFVDIRDEALCRIKAEAFPRASDLLSMTISGTSVREGHAMIIGKGNKARILPFGPTTAVALDRYLRARKKHKKADTDRFWLGDRNNGFGYEALYCAMVKRAEMAGIDGFHPHRLRTTGAVRWRRKGGSELGLMKVGGWSSLEMVQRYTEFSNQEIAVEEAHGLGLGDL